MNWNELTPDSLAAGILQRLSRAAHDPKHALRTAVLGTARENDCRLRSVILREVHPRERRLVCFSDVRTGKIHELHHGSRAGWLFYDPAEQVQIRAGGATTVHFRNQFARRAWESRPVASRVNYCSIGAPASEIADPALALPEELRGHRATAENTAAGWANFAVISTTIEELDWLRLNPAGHRRARAVWTGRQWKGHWVVP